MDGAGAGRSWLTLELGYDLTGPFAWLVERIAARIVGRNLEASVTAAKRILERGPREDGRSGAADGP